MPSAVLLYMCTVEVMYMCSANTDLDPEKFEEFNQIANLKKTTQQTRDQTFGYFEDYLASQQEKSGEAAKDLGELLNCEEGRNKFCSSMYFSFYL